MSEDKDTNIEQQTIVQKAGREMLEHRTARMMRLIELGAPSIILCQEALLIFRAACQIDPAVAGRALSDSLVTAYLYEKRICHGCQNAMAIEGACFCAECKAGFEKLEREDDAALNVCADDAED